MALHKCKSMSVFISTEKERKICLKILSSLCLGGKNIPRLVKVLNIGCRWPKLLSNFSNIPMESGKMVRSGSSQEELLETACKAGICSSKRIPLLDSAALAQRLTSVLLLDRAASSNFLWNVHFGGRNIWYVHLGLDNKCICWTSCSRRG